MPEMYYKAAEFLDLRKNHITSPVISPSWPTLGTSWNSWSIGYSVPNGWHTKVSRMPMAPVNCTISSSSGYAFFPWPAYRKSLYTPLKGVPSCDRRISKLFVRPGMLEKTLSNVFTYLPTCPKDVCLMSPFWLRLQEKVWPDGSPGLPKDLCSFCHVGSGASKFFMLALLSFWRFFV